MANSAHATEISSTQSIAPAGKSPSTSLKIVGFLLVVIGTILINYNYNNRLDIISDDDDLYFSFGMMLLKGKYRGADDGPLYYVFQLLLQLITNDAIRTFYINYIVTTSVPMVLFYLLLRARNINVWLAVWISLMFTFSNFNYPLTPKLTHYATIFLLMGLGAFTYTEGLRRKFFLCSLFTLLASYVRPELYIAFFLLSVITGFICFRERKYAYILIIVTITLICGYILGTPIGANDRSFWTFKHHFSINYIDSHPELNLSPWNHFNQITTNAFGHKLTSVKDAILTDPGLVFWHIKTNIIHYLKVIPSQFRNILFDSIQFPFRKYVLLGLALFVLFRIDFRNSRDNVITIFRSNALFLLVFVMMLLPTFISNFFIYPRTHYVLYHFFLYLYVLALLSNCVVFKNFSIVRPILLNYLLIGLNLVFIVLLYIPKYKESAQNKPLPSKAFAFMLRDCHLKGPISALGGDAPFSYDRYVGQDWTFHYFDIIRPESFAQCLDDFRVNCIIINDKMQRYFEKDPTYRLFLTNPAANGFLLVKKTDTHKVYAKNRPTKNNGKPTF